MVLTSGISIGDIGDVGKGVKGRWVYLFNKLLVEP